MTNLDTLFNEESKDVLAEMEAESASLLSRMGGDNLMPSGLEALRAGQSFEEVAQQQWNGLQNAGDQQNTDPLIACDGLPYTAKFYTGGIDFTKLTTYIKINYTGVFDYTKFEGVSVYHPGTGSDPMTGVFGSGDYTSVENVPFEYTNGLGERISTVFSGRLNFKQCYLELRTPNLQWGWSLELDAKKKNMQLSIEYYYKDTFKSSTPVLSTPNPNDYTIDEKYKAIILSTGNVNDFLALILDLYGKDSNRNLQNSIAEKYIAVLNNTCTDTELKYLYDNIPEFVLDKIRETKAIAPEKLWEDLETLTNYDDTGKLSFFKDASGALIKVLKAMGDSTMLYTKFVSNPKFIRRIYYNLDGTSTVEQPGIDKDGKLVTNAIQVTNRIIFSNFLVALCAYNGFKDLTVNGHSFYVGTMYKLDANVTGTGEGNDKFFLKQMKYVPFGGMDFLPSSLDEEIDMEDGALYGPLDIVYLIDTSQQNEVALPVPAILVKALSDQEEWQEIETAIRIGFDLLGLILGAVAVATTGNPLLFALAVADIGLSAADIGIQAFRKDIEEMEGGKEFLERWEKIYLVGNLITAGPQLIAGICKFGSVLLKTAEAVKNFKIKNFVLAVFTKIILERNIANFAKNSFEAVADLEKEFGVSAFTTRLANLQKEGVALFKGFMNGDNIRQFCLFFNGKIVSIGDLKQLISDVSAIARAKGANLLERINSFLALLRKERTIVNTSARIGENATADTIKWGTVKMKSHPRFEEMMKFLKERKIELVEIEDIANDVGYTETMVYDKADNLIRVEKKLEWHPEMRFLDLEHEVDHIIQFEKNLQGKFCTFMQKDLGAGRLQTYKNGTLGLTSDLQKSFLEYEERIREILRLKESGAPKPLIEEHLGGLKDSYKEYQGKYPRNPFDRPKFEKWKKEYFPDFEEFDFANFNF